MKVPSTITTLLVGVSIALLSVWIGQHHGLMPVAASEESTQIDELFSAMLAIAAGLFFLVQGALLYSLIAFRKKPGDETDAEPIEGNVPLEILWTAVPTVLMMWLAVYSFDVYKSVDGGNAIGADHMAHVHHASHTVASADAPSPKLAAMSGMAIAAPLPTNAPAVGQPSGTELAQFSMPEMEQGTDKEDNPLVVNVNGLQYAWIFNYPDTGVVAGELHLPLGKPVYLNINAADVIHAFWVPEFRLKQDAVPGIETHMSFVPSKVGNYPLICAELCGAYHGGMRTRVIVQTPEDYQAWVKSNQVAAADTATRTANLIAQAQDAAMHSQIHALGLTADASSLEHLHHQAMSFAQTSELAQSL
ncbi:MAG: cytochrome c oxidase subunit II [Thermosynechococcaceae cyanobacterium MS004]|nr:cytochrome c oxidase subunit II [Thermosynechococcaceae cyanobacterium MS004]